MLLPLGHLCYISKAEIERLCRREHHIRRHSLWRVTNRCAKCFHSIKISIVCDVYAHLLAVQHVPWLHHIVMVALELQARNIVRVVHTTYYIYQYLLLHHLRSCQHTASSTQWQHASSEVICSVQAVHSAHARTLHPLTH
jgi:hypothetical protein